MPPQRRSMSPKPSSVFLRRRTNTVPNQRSMRRGTVALTIEHDGGLVVTAPNDVSVDKLEAVVRDKAFWVLQQLRQVRELAPRPAPREFVSGETVLYLGRQFRLRVVDAGENVGTRMWAGWYEIPVDRSLEGEERRREVRRRLMGAATIVNWLRENAERRVASCRHFS